MNIYPNGFICYILILMTFDVQSKFQEKVVKSILDYCGLPLSYNSSRDFCFSAIAKATKNNELSKLQLL